MGTIDADIQEFISDASFNILLVGRLSEEKNINSAIKAISHPSIASMNIKLCIVGEGALQGKLLDIAKEQGVLDRVFFAGYRKNVEELMRSFDILVMPSISEGLPITILEAMKVGLPVIASAVGGIPSALDQGKAGVVIEKPDDEALKEAIIGVIQNDVDVKEVVKHAQYIFKERYTDIAMAKKYFDIYMAFVK